MKSNNNIDHFFKDKLQNREFVLEDAFIANLEYKLDKQKKRNFFWIKSSLGFLSFVGLFFVGFYYTNLKSSINSNPINYSDTINIETFNDENINRKKNNVSDIDKKERINEEKIEPKTSVRSNNNPYFHQLKKELTNLKKDEIELQKLKNTSKEQKVLSMVDENISDKKLTITAINKKSKILEFQSKKTNEDIELHKEYIEIEPEKENIKPKNGKENKIIELKKDTFNTTLTESNTKMKQVLNNDSVNEIVKVFVGGEKLEKPKGLTNKKWAVSIFVGPFIINKSVSGKQNEAYYTKRKEEEKKMSTLNYGFEIGYLLSEKINVSTGINTITYGEDTKYSIEKIITKTVISSYDTIVNIDSLGLPIDTITTPNYTNQITSKKTSEEISNKNRYTSIQIPFMFGYKKHFNKFGLNVKTGIIYGRLINSRGSYINSSGNNVEPVELKKNIFSIALSTELSYNFNNLRIFIDPKYQFNITNVFPNTSTNQKYKVFGLNFGIGIEF